MSATQCPTCDAPLWEFVKSDGTETRVCDGSTGRHHLWIVTEDEQLITEYEWLADLDAQRPRHP